MLFQYVGHGVDSPLTCDIFDLHFVLGGEPVEVEDERAIKKLIGNNSFVFEPALILSEDGKEQKVEEIAIEKIEGVVDTAIPDIEPVVIQRGRPRR